ncbi:MAG: DUF1499 domain-containing protein [Candidatus Polarisedimenticolaceae bacterium]|nr:DUF1499 domain-containing protein [Candidatus Polarisedimenticolaceae bacterium]
MIKIAIIFGLLISAVVILFVFLGFIARSGEAAGMVGEELLRCPAKPNCVCSEFRDDVDHYIEPIVIPSDVNGDVKSTIKEAIQVLGGEIQTDNGDYIAAIFSSSLFGFIDDLEVRLSATQSVIHTRSASRVGYGDFGVNRRRVESLRELLHKRFAGD